MISFIVVIVTGILGTAYGQTNCTSLPDGIYEIGCKVYDVCRNHVLTSVECHERQVYDSRYQTCRPEGQVPPPCGLVRDCSSKSDGSYVELSQNCTSYYTCSHHVYFGHNFCTPGTVFEQTMGTCVWPVDSYPPCGTRV